MPTPILLAALTCVPATTDPSWISSLLHALGLPSATSCTVGDLAARPTAVVVVLVVSVVVGRYGSKAIRRGLGRAGGHAASRSDSPRATARISSIVALLANLWRVVVAVVAILVGLSAMGLDLTPLVAGATVIGATIGFGAQSLVRDFLSGILLTMEDQYGIGDTITMDAVTGVVEDLSLRVTRVRALDGTLWSVCNGEIRKVANLSRGSARVFVDVVVPSTVAMPEVMDALDHAGEDLAADERWSSACLDRPEIWGVVASDATTATVRLAVQTTVADRAGLERGYREVAVSRLQQAGLLETDV